MSEFALNRIILEKNNHVLAVISVASLALCLMLAIMLIFSVNKKPLIVYEDSDEMTALKQRDFKLDENILEGFVHLISKEYLSFSPASLPAQIEGIKDYLTDNPKNSILDSFKKNEKRLQEDNVFQQFTINEINITKKNSPYLAEVKGIKTIYASGNSKNIQASYIFEIERIKQTQSNPYGLIVSKIIEKPEEKGVSRK